MKAGKRFPLIAFLIISIIAGIIRSNCDDNGKLSHVELLAYRSGTQLFYQGKNPYDGQAILNLEKSYGYSDNLPLFVWNPPLFFLIPGAILLLPLKYLFGAWCGVLYFSGLFLVWAGFSSTGVNKPSEAIPLQSIDISSVVLIAITAYPLFIEASLLQVSTFVCCAICIGFYLFFSKKDFGAGICFTLGVIKPHIVFLPLLLAALWTIRGRRFRVIGGFCIGIITLTLLTEVIHPEITSLWLHRNEWPTVYLGSSVNSLLTFIAHHIHRELPATASIITPLCFLALFILWRGKWILSPSVHEVLASSLFIPFVMPYGFAFDHVAVLPVAGYIYGRWCNRSKIAGLISVCILAGISLLAFSATGIEILGAPISWYLYPILLFILFVFTERFTNSSEKQVSAI